MKASYLDVLALSENYESGQYELSAFSSALLLSMLGDNPAASYLHWSDLTESEKEAARDKYDAAVKELMIPVTTGGAVNNRAVLMPYNANVNTGAGIAWVVNTSQQFNGYFMMSPAANNDEHEFTLALSPGDYWAVFVAITSTQGAYGRMLIDGENAGLQDWYSSPNEYNARKIYPFTRESSDPFTLGLKAEGKNPLSTAYRLMYTYLDIRLAP